MPTTRRSGTVLVVEDEPIQRMMIADLVEEAGLDVIEALDADDAVRILETRLDVRVVFADIDMPGGFDGMKLAASIRDRWPPIELILTSARRDVPLHEIPARGIFFLKPFREDKIVEALVNFTR